MVIKLNTWILVVNWVSFSLSLSFFLPSFFSFVCVSLPRPLACVLASSVCEYPTHLFILLFFRLMAFSFHESSAYTSKRTCVLNRSLRTETPSWASIYLRSIPVEKLSHKEVSGDAIRHKNPSPIQTMKTVTQAFWRENSSEPFFFGSSCKRKPALLHSVRKEGVVSIHLFWSLLLVQSRQGYWLCSEKNSTFDRQYLWGFSLPGILKH